ncbi:tail fiber assembly protein [Enterobacter asburiae]|uniref:tail fiber assembly protein n=1 Tax=Enterobacter asburiae TaxID=61645 RepID=UPI0007B3E0CE|nr:tail fiber assembly protein [Enterobacter asburiae]ELY2957384.1 tail fiber assembly protein [Cronobacter sakazakii]KZR47717.1 tail fiber assembly protein [Enterobacter asburiae]
MQKYLYAAETNAFYPLVKQTDYEAVGMWPEKGVEVDEALFVLFQSPPPGKIRVSGTNGMPAWADIPPLTQEEIIAKTIAIRNIKITEANTFINERQWPGKAVLGRLNEDEKRQYGLWLDYLEELEAVNASAEADIIWPSQP